MEIVDYDPDWFGDFEAERQRISRALGSLARRIDHNGSTSVRGLAAKPILDIQISVEHLHPLSTYEGLLATLGYVHVPHSDDSFCPFFHKPTTWPHTHHIHVVQAGGDEERRTLAFRDYLRANEAVAREYEQLKRELVRRYDTETLSGRERYADAKSGFIERVVQAALDAGFGKDL
ncbi:MAG: hypothetical protein C5B57_00425 [Blastocatellia bacterium]|nr:MAG: hypothetical protein C5B57_00425 [Blastocatellia bacterium]